MNRLPTRLIVDPPRPGVWNMAVDEALLESAAADGVATLRFYRWGKPTLSLGYFQKLADRELHAASRGCPVVRRRSGGGAIVHDRELTYSLALPADAPQVGDTEQVYRRAHQSLIATLGELAAVDGVAAAADLCSAAIPAPSGDEPFLCFQRRARCDVLLPARGEQHAGQTATVDGRHKVCGSAQRKHAGAVLQHGGLLLRRSEAAPELPGVADLTAADFGADDVMAHWKGRLADHLGLELANGELTEGERRRANELAAGRFADPAWIGRR